MDQEDSWSVAVEDLLDKGDSDGAISLLESLITKLQTLNSSSSDLQLATALSDLANLYSSKGFSLKADQLQTRSFLIKQRSLSAIHSSPRVSESAEENDLEGSKVLGGNDASASNGPPSDDDWEAIADRAPDEILSPQHAPSISELSLKETDTETPKRRGRGSFLYKKNSLYSDQQSNVASRDYDDEDDYRNSEGSSKVGNSTYGTNHVLVLSDFPPSTRTTELEKLYENFRDRGVVIRWVNDTVALAVFKTPSLALEARNDVKCSFTVRLLDENDSFLSSISRGDLEPPYPRPKTSVRTAQRLIAHGMGRKLSKEKFGSGELRKQEEARKTRIVTRQIKKDEAWGDD